jgi:hypothetical protein
MSDTIFIKDNQTTNPYFADLTEMPRQEAGKLLRQSGLIDQGRIDLQKACEYEALPLRFLHIEEENCAARLVQTAGDWFLEVNNDGSGEDNFSTDATTRRRQRFSIAHELGHHKFKSHCDRELQQALLSGHNPHAHSYLRQREVQANEFATEMLLPFSILQKSLKDLDFKNDLFKSIEDLADRFDTSMIATVKRVASILDIPVIAIHFAPDGRSHQVPSYSRDFKAEHFYFSRDGVIPEGSFTAAMYDGKTPATRGKKVHRDTRVWFPDRRGDNYKTIEWALNIGRYGILTFLELVENDNYST